MANSWRVMLNSRLWNQERYEEEFRLRPEARRLPQSKGKRGMKTLPQMGDSVRFVYKGRIVMRGIIYSDGFEYRPSAEEHSCNMGIQRPHAESNEYAWVNITEVGLSEYIRRTGQQTWIQYKDIYGTERV